MSDWENLKKTAQDRGEIQDFIDIELEHLKKRQIKYWSATPEQRKIMVKNNFLIRKDVSKIFNNDETKVNEFMYAKDFETWKKRQPRFSNILSNIERKRNLGKGLKTVVYDATIHEPKTDIAPKEEEIPILDKTEPNFNTYDPDIDRGIAPLFKKRHQSRI